MQLKILICFPRIKTTATAHYSYNSYNTRNYVGHPPVQNRQISQYQYTTNV